MSERKLRLLYIWSDIIFSMVAWSLFFVFRKVVFEHDNSWRQMTFVVDINLAAGIIAIPTFWLVIYYVYGYYRDPLRKSRLRELGDTLLITICGTLFLFFLLVLDDQIDRYTNYYYSFGVLMALQFTLTYIPRYIITSNTVKQIQRGRVGFRTLIIGGNGKAIDIYNKIRSQKRSTGNIFSGFVTIKPGTEMPLAMHLPLLGSLIDLNEVMDKNDFREVIIAVESSESEIIGEIMNILARYDVLVKSIPGVHDILMGRVKMSSIFGTPLILLSDNLMPAWQQNVKQLTDYIGSLLALLLSLPVSLVLAIAIKAESRGPLIFTQTRIGKKGKPFRIYKFRSMHPGAEKDMPLLSSDNDPRVTRVGRYMRRHRLDEIPNFINVLKGEMSIVGPRPERQYYIDLITEKAPSYLSLLRIKPGITSWGQVMYGYASDVDQMVERLQYDLIYLENMSLYVDLKIIIYTVITVIRGRGV